MTKYILRGIDEICIAGPKGIAVIMDYDAHTKLMDIKMDQLKTIAWEEVMQTVDDGASWEHLVAM